MLELTKEQCHELKKENGESVRILDPETHQEYVLVRAVLFDRLKSLLAIDEEKEFANEIYPQVMEVFAREGWNDPSMDIYNELDPRGQS